MVKFYVRTYELSRGMLARLKSLSNGLPTKTHCNGRWWIDAMVP